MSVTLWGKRWKLRSVFQDGDNSKPVVGVEIAVGDGADDPETFSLDQAEALASEILSFVRRQR